MMACACAEAWDEDVFSKIARPQAGEGRMLRPLLAWLNGTRRITPDTHVALELSWFGRRVDVATLTRSRRAVAYELKLGSLGRALEQAVYNRISFDRSYV